MPVTRELTEEVVGCLQAEAVRPGITPGGGPLADWRTPTGLEQGQGRGPYGRDRGLGKPYRGTSLLDPLTGQGGLEASASADRPPIRGEVWLDGFRRQWA